MTAAGLAWGAYEAATRNRGIAGGPVPRAAPFRDPLPPLPGAPMPRRGPAPPLPGARAPADLLRLVRLTISAARADGSLSPEEQEAIVAHARSVGAEQLVEYEVRNPRPLSEIAAGVTDPKTREEMYQMAFAVVRADEAVTRRGADLPGAARARARPRSRHHRAHRERGRRAHRRRGRRSDDERAEWYMAIGGHQVGPVSADEIVANLRNGTIDAATLVFKQGMTRVDADPRRAGVPRPGRGAVRGRPGGARGAGRAARARDRVHDPRRGPAVRRGRARSRRERGRGSGLDDVHDVGHRDGDGVRRRQRRGRPGRDHGRAARRRQAPGHRREPVHDRVHQPRARACTASPSPPPTPAAS